MSPLIDAIIRTLETEPVGETRDEAMGMAADIFEKARGMKPCGWHPEIVDARLDEEEVASLKQTVIALAEREAVGSWALSKCDDPALKPVFLRMLQRQIYKDPGEMYQAMIALSDLGENIFSDGNYSSSVLNESLNRELAKAYLEKTGTGPAAI